MNTKCTCGSTACTRRMARNLAPVCQLPRKAAGGVTIAELIERSKLPQYRIVSPPLQDWQTPGMPHWAEPEDCSTFPREQEAV